MKKFEAKYGLPHDIKYCKKCNMSNQQPMSSNEYKHSSNSKKTMGFHDDGICNACKFNEFKDDGTIDWKLRGRN